MRIERSGGIAGLKATVERDAAALSATERHAIEAVRAAAPPASASASAAGAAAAQPPTRGLPSPADRFRYRIVLTDTAGQVTTRVVEEAQMPEALQQLCRPGV